MHSSFFELKGTSVKVLSEGKKFCEAGIDEFIKQRNILEEFVSVHPLFAESLLPVTQSSGAPESAKRMHSASVLAGVGPMAAVAGTIAQIVAEKMVSLGAETAIVDNGGDVFAVSKKSVNTGIFSGFSEKSYSLELPVSLLPSSICSSSSCFGHSFSFGNCSLATVLASNASVADAFATGLCNKICSESDISKSLEWACSFPEVTGAIVVFEKKLFTQGNVPKISSSNSKLVASKITKPSYSDWNISFNPNYYLTFC